MKVLNNTHYLSVHSLYYNEFASPNSFCYESSRRNSYFQRLYYEFLDPACKLVLFFTLTYNNISIPYFYGKPCFSYEHIRYVVNGKLSKWLLRHFNCRLRYFVACESGDGKGKRGLGNNPHYHIIFFIRPIDGDLHGLNQYSFKSMIEEVWQGQSGPCDWKTAKFGHCQPGDNNGLVSSSSAFSYVCKYVTKDSGQLGYESWLKDKFKQDVINNGFNTFFLYSYYKYLENTRSINNKSFSRALFLSTFKLLNYNSWRHYYNKYRPGLDTSYESFLLNHHGTIGKHLYNVLHNWFTEKFVPSCVDTMYAEYRNNYSAKVRCSKSLGEYGLNFLVEQDNGVKLKINTPKGYKVQNASLYYIRKKYYNVKICPYSGCPLYYLNEDGLNYKLRRFDFDYKHLIESIYAAKSLFPQLGLNSDLSSKLSYLFGSDELEFILHTYACYSLVYKYRRYEYFDSIKLSEDCDIDDVKQDCRLFLSENSYSLDYEECTIHQFLLSRSQNLLSFSQHLAFSPYYKYYSILDELLDIVSSYYDSERRKIFSENRDFLKRHKSFKYNQIR